jgi:2'-hydroxyisoflavone reductase
MKILVLGGTAWLGQTVVREALAAGHAVSCVARGASGAVPEGAKLVVCDRDAADGLDRIAAPSVSSTDALVWDLVLDLTRQPGQARRAVQRLGPLARHWVYVSSVSVLADTSTPDQDESAVTVEPLVNDVAEAADYAAAKRACELAVMEGLGPSRCLIARAGLIGGPGDHTGRTGYWPLRFARPATADGAVLVPDAAKLPVQVIDVRDLAAWLLVAGTAGVAGIFNACGNSVPLGEHLRIACEVGRAAGLAGAAPGHAVPASPDWLVEQGVRPWSGVKSLPLWVPRPAYDGFGGHRNVAAQAAGLRLRSLRDTLADTLAWELATTPTYTRMAGISADEERALLQALPKAQH